jgi:hypothetical protein
MKNFKLASLFLLVSFFIIGCDDDSDPSTITINTAVPTGTFTASKTGTFVDQNTKGTKGDASLGTDVDGENFLKFDSDFATTLATGTVTVYLSTSNTLTLDASDNSNNKLVGIVQANGETFYKLASAPDSKFTHVILWCGSARVPFGNAELK